MKQIIFPPHAQQQMIERGASKEEIIDAIHNGERLYVKYSRTAYRKNFQYNKIWGKKFYHIKQVMPIVKEEKSIVVITVYTFYF